MGGRDWWVCESAAALCRAAGALDLAGAPVYVLVADDVRGIVGEHGLERYGWTASWADLVLRERIGPEWRGRGPTCVVDTAGIRAGCCLRNEYDFLKAVCAVALHELAHAIEGSFKFGTVPDWTPTEASRLAATLRSMPVTPPEPRVEREQHGPRFIRTMIHLKHRAGAAGGPVGWVCDGTTGADRLPSYGRGVAMESLEREAQSRAAEPIGAILATPPPRAFAKLAREWEKARDAA